MNLFEARATVEQSPDEVFRWHRRPGAFERLLPPWEDVRILDRTGGVEVGSRIRMRVRRGPVSFDWTVEHTSVEEGRSFTDEQVKGPFGSWKHVHRFLPAEGGGCVVEDEIHWSPPLKSVSSVFAEPLVEGALSRLFGFRHRRLRHDLDRLSSGARLRGIEEDGDADSKPLSVAMTGASGLVGRNLSAFLRAGGHRVIPLVRSRERVRGNSIYWSVEDEVMDGEALEGVDAMIHLAGEPLFALRWTEGKKRRIRESRVRGTGLVARTLAGLEGGPRVLISASGVHYYGDRGDEVLTEESASGEGFLADVCRQWEAATEPAAAAGIRVVTVRSGVVLTPAGGALEKMLLPFKLGVGGRLGSGRQYMSWIDADDQVGLLHHVLTNRDVRGPVNAAAPGPVPNAAFTDALGRVLERPTVLPLPSLAVKASMGEMGETLLLQGQRAHPEAALASGFDFRFPDVESSLRHQLGRKRSPT